VSDPGPTPAEFKPGDRVRLRYGMFQGLVGEMIGPDVERRGEWQVRLLIWEREIEVGLAGWMLELVPPGPPAG
jgi:transcription antitermination factor NusG